MRALELKKMLLHLLLLPLSWQPGAWNVLASGRTTSYSYNERGNGHMCSCIRRHRSCSSSALLPALWGTHSRIPGPVMAGQGKQLTPVPINENIPFDSVRVVVHIHGEADEMVRTNGNKSLMVVGAGSFLGV